MNLRSSIKYSLTALATASAVLAPAIANAQAQP